MESERGLSALRRFAVVIACFCLMPWAQAAAQSTDDPLYLYKEYNEFRDPKANLAEGAARARSEGKRVLLEVGGDWCGWCHVLDRFLAENALAHDAFAKSFVIVKVNYSQRQKNEAFLSQYPKIRGYPAFIVLDAEGKLLGVQRTGELEVNQTYSRMRMVAFAERWRVQ